MKKYLNKSTVGQFIFNDKTYPGNLDIQKSKIILTIYLEIEASEPAPRVYPEVMQGTLYPSSKVTLLDIIPIGNKWVFTSDQDGKPKKIQEITLDIAYVVFVNKPINDKQSLFSSVDFSINNSNHLFYFHSFFLLNTTSSKELAKGLIEQDLRISEAKYGLGGDIESYSFGERPDIFIFTGALILADLKLSIGRLQIRNNPNFTYPSNSGFTFENRVSCYLKFNELKSFWDIAKKIHEIKNLFELIVGKAQFLQSYRLKVDGVEDLFDVYNATADAEMLTDSIHPLNRLIHVEKELDEFRLVLNNWLSRQEEWSSARNYYFSVYRNIEYTPDTLVKLSSLFEMIPKTVYPEGVVSKNQKISNRYEVIKKSGFIQLNDMDIVISQTVGCRNHYVHGNAPKFDYEKHFGEFCFLITTLLFIYGISEMIEAGWTFENWKPDELNSHPFSTYLVNYDRELTNLKKVLNT